jgi:dTDP-3-amino-3,4,6-trideoxy-alpha-D-glucose transaminase
MAALHSPSVPLLRLDNSDPELVAELLEVVARVASTGAFTMGDELEAFEQDFAAYCGAPHAIGVSSGTEALVLALRALGIGRGDEVIVPANSFIATAEAVVLAGAEPVLVDVDPETALITADLIAEHISPRTRCIIPVHLCGRTVDLDPIVALARRAGVAVVEDTAQAHGALYRGRRVGTIGDVGCFSFYPTKNLGGWGDGGAVITADAGLADTVKLLRSHGEKPRYHHRIVGTTARLDALQAAILRVKLGRLEGWNDSRRRLAARLDEGLHTGVVSPPAAASEDGDHVYHLYVVRSDERDALREHLAERGIASAIHYPVPIHRTDAFAHLGLGPGSRPVTEELTRTILTLPLWPTMADEEVDAVIEAVGSFEPQAIAIGGRYS